MYVVRACVKKLPFFSFKFSSINRFWCTRCKITNFQLAMFSWCCHSLNLLFFSWCCHHSLKLLFFSPNVVYYTLFIVYVTIVNHCYRYLLHMLLIFWIYSSLSLSHCLYFEFVFSRQFSYWPFALSHVSLYWICSLFTCFTISLL